MKPANFKAFHSEHCAIVQGVLYYAPSTLPEQRYFHIWPLFSQHIGNCLETDGWYGEWRDWDHDPWTGRTVSSRRLLRRGCTPTPFSRRRDVASQVHGARHPYAPEPLTASCLHASVGHLVEGTLCATTAPSERERRNVFFTTLSMPVLLILVPPVRQFTYSQRPPAVYNSWTGLDWTGLEWWTGLRIYVIFIRACVELLNSTCIRLSYCTACVKVEVRALYIVRHGVVRGEQRRSYCFGQPPFLGQGAG